MRVEIGRRLERNERDRARHRFADRIIEFAVANATVELPDLLVERELEVMVDELKVRLAEQRIGYEDYLRATERDEAQLIESFRPDAEKRIAGLMKPGSCSPRQGRSSRRTSKGSRWPAASCTHPLRTLLLLAPTGTADTTRRQRAYLGSFRISGGTVSDGCDQTDGIDAYTGYLGPSFPDGLFVCQDGFTTHRGALARRTSVRTAEPGRRQPVTPSRCARRRLRDSCELAMSRP